MSLWRTGIIFDGPDALSVTVKGLGTGTVMAVEPLQMTGRTPEELAELLRALTHDRPQRRGQFRIVLPHQQCENYLRVHETPLPSEAVLGDAVRWLEEECGFDPNAYDVNASTYILGGRQAVAISAMERGLLERYRSAFEAVKLYDIVLVSPLDALISMAQSTERGSSAATRAIIQVGQESTAVLAVEDGLPTFYRSLSQSLETQPSDAATQGGEMNHAMPQQAPTDASIDRLVDELARTLQYFQQTSTRGQQVGHITLASLNLDLRAMATKLTQRTSVACEMAGASIVQLPGGSGDATIDILSEQRLTLPASVASQRHMNDSSKLIATPSRAQRVARSRGTWVAAVLLYVLVLFVIWALLVGYTQRLSDKVVELERKDQRVSQALTRRQQEYAVRKLYAGNARSLLQIKHQGVVASDMLSAANNIRPEAVKFERVALDAGDGLYTLRLSGNVPGVASHDALRILDQYASQLAGMGVYDHTFIDKPRLEGAGAERDPHREAIEPKSEGPAAVDFTIVLQKLTPWRKEGGK